MTTIDSPSISSCIRTSVTPCRILSLRGSQLVFLNTSLFGHTEVLYSLVCWSDSFRACWDVISDERLIVAVVYSHRWSISGLSVGCAGCQWVLLPRWWVHLKWLLSSHVECSTTLLMALVKCWVFDRGVEEREICSVEVYAWHVHLVELARHGLRCFLTSNCFRDLFGH